MAPRSAPPAKPRAITRPAPGRIMVATISPIPAPSAPPVSAPSVLTMPGCSPCDWGTAANSLSPASGVRRLIRSLGTPISFSSATACSASARALKTPTTAAMGFPFLACLAAHGFRAGGSALPFIRWFWPAKRQPTVSPREQSEGTGAKLARLEGRGVDFDRGLTKRFGHGCRLRKPNLSKLADQVCGPTIDIVLAHGAAERLHATLDLRRGHFQSGVNGVRNQLGIVRIHDQRVVQFPAGAREAAQDEHAAVVVARRDVLLGDEIHAVVEGGDQT